MTTLSEVFVIIAESGEYEQRDKRVAAVFTDEAAAIEAINYAGICTSWEEYSMARLPLGVFFAR